MTMTVNGERTGVTNATGGGGGGVSPRGGPESALTCAAEGSSRRSLRSRERPGRDAAETDSGLA